VIYLIYRVFEQEKQQIFGLQMLNNSACTHAAVTHYRNIKTDPVNRNAIPVVPNESIGALNLLRSSPIIKLVYDRLLHKYGCWVRMCAMR
jgi:hypothetical protein